ncbi:hypothetical protein [Kerstersia gyiorum]|uniref:hypothetical protein n=1 Tax=Kerstersia gyiorum TaxID=206506 RepID=UPI0020A1EFAF|nr:hypothetical protein [Kerstersia gyiorum]MCP1679413.1 hypothetical protein [Kerstersia gyiorum]MCP1823916.1 hypothetical protein [Kerstersia gyiorum]MCP1827357.1 hypothetical protein [Kerstersia gyiorum]MCW2448994.1 hypothetical protein [Kerstersia gyiorum]
MAIIKLMPPRVQLMDPRTGLITREWYAFFLALFERVGGILGPGTNDLAEAVDEAAGVAELQAMLGNQIQGAMVAPPLAAMPASSGGMEPPIQPPAIATPMDQGPPRAVGPTQAPGDQQARLEALEALVRRLQQEIESLKQG